jgi:phosphate-selective porin OprO/OprP
MERWAWNRTWIVLVIAAATLAPADRLRAQDAPPAQPETPARPAAEDGDAPKDDAATIEDLEQRLKILERKDELNKEQAAEKARQSPIVTAAGKDGFTIRTPDGASFLRIRGYIQADAQLYVRDNEAPLTDTFVLRRVRPVFEGTVARFFDYKFMPDFGAGTTVVQDAYMDWKFGKPVRLMIGKYKGPVGLERLQSAQDLLFVSRGLPTNLVPNRDLGLTLHGDPFDGILSYAAGIFNGVPDGGSADLDTNNGKEGAARLFVLPFKRTAIGALQGFGIGVAGTYGQNVGTPKSPGLSTYKTAGLYDFFTWLNDGTQATAPTAAGTTVGDGRRYRVSPQAYWYAERFGALAEYVRSTQDVERGAFSDTLTSEAWGVTVSFLLTPDAASYKGVTPKHPFDPDARAWGAFELVARAGALTVDKGAFPNFADPAKSARAARDRGFGVNWYLSRNFRFMLDYIETQFQGGAAAGADRENERVILNRFQVAF